MATICDTNKIDSNITGLSYAEEECPKILPTDPVPVWKPLEPNSYNDFGGQITTVARAPISRSRQRQKGTPTDLDASGAFNMDLTETNLQDLLQGYMFADVRTKQTYTRTGTVGDISVEISGGFPRLVSAGAVDFTTFGLIPGEWIFVGGDASAAQFVNDENNGFKRIYSIEADTLTFDKSVAPMVAEDGTDVGITLYFGKVLKNESDPSLIKRRTYQLERTLGSLDGLQPPQSEYLLGSVANELSLNLATADKVTVDLSFVSMDFEQRTQAQGIKTGTRDPLVAGDAFNTSSDFKRVKLSSVSSLDAVPTPLFTFMQEGTLTINNGITPNKGIGVMGAFDTSAGDFVVSGTLTAYFSDITSVQAVRNNTDITLDVIMVKNGHAMVFDLPLVTLGDGRVNVTKDEPITLPLSFDAASASRHGDGFDYTAMWVFFDGLPALANQ
jgi:hypothetical protein